MKRLDGQTLFLIVAVIIASSVVGLVGWTSRDGQAQTRGALTLDDIPFDGGRAYGILKQLCELGSRASGTIGMQQQQQLLSRHFRKLGAQFERQEFRIRDPRDGSEVKMANLIVQWHPEKTERILLCAHYDTRPFPDRDPDPTKRKGLFVGANDGASGVAILAELGRHMAELNSKYGVDFVLFDGEEYVFDDQDEYFLGSTYFAKQFAENPPVYTYRWGVLLDMVGDAQLNIYPEGHSWGWPDTRPLVVDIWRTARRLGVREFINNPRLGHTVKDDHLPLHNIAKISCCDIIDFDYPRPGLRGSYWHTTRDVPENCSPLSLAKVGWVIHEWLKGVE